MRILLKSENLIKDTDNLLNAFGLDKKKSWKYEEEYEAVAGAFGQLCGSYSRYMEWLDHYRHNLEGIEYLIRALKDEIWFTADSFVQADVQSARDRLGNTAHKLLWLRRAGKAWRNREIAKLRENVAA